MLSPAKRESLFDAARHVPHTMRMFHVLGGTNFIIGIVAHFYLILVAGLVQSFLTAPVSVPEPGAPASEMGGHTVSVAAVGGAAATAAVFDPWTMSIFVLLSALVIVGVSFLARWSWPMVSEKALLTVLLWLLYGVIVSDFGICVCCTSGSWHHVCGGAWYEQSISLLWILAALASFLVDAWSLALRRVSIVATVGIAIALFIAPVSNCSALPTAHWLLFLRVTLFHLLWHSNRLQRIAESTIYGIYARCTRALDEVRVVRPNDPETLSVDVPMAIVTTWRVLVAIAQEASLAQDAAQQQGPTLFAKQSQRAPQNRGVFSAPPDFTATRTFLEALHETRNGLPHLSVFAENCGNGEGPHRHWIDWKYRHYSHTLMLAIDTVRSGWVLGVCPSYLVLAVAELAWLWYTIYHTCAEIVSTTRNVEQQQQQQQQQQHRQAS
jgi:hypothetical protein